jgi:hypothetical protein
MKTFKPHLLLFLLCGLLAPSQIFAVKVVGGEIRYQYISKNAYNVYLTIYAQCGGPSLCTGCPNTPGFKCPIQLNIRGAAAPTGSNTPPNPYAGQSFGSIKIPPIPGISGKELKQLCSQASSNCTDCGQKSPGSFSPGIEAYYFGGTIDLSHIPDSCCWVSISFDTCCRNNNISTLIQTNPQNFFIQTTINRCVSPGNSAPVLTNAPIFLVCNGQDYSNTLGAIDPDGDSLSYALGAIRTAPTVDVMYKPPFSPSIPMPYLGYPAIFNENQKPQGFHLNVYDGSVWFKPIDTFTSYLSIDILEWRSWNGIPMLKGISSREIQIFSKNCPSNTAPNILVYDKNGLLKTDPTFEICAGNEICFTLTAKDSLTTVDTTHLSFSSDRINPIIPILKKQYIDSIRPRHDSMQFCWTPTSSYTRRLPYFFNVFAKDNSCPFPIKSSKAIAIYVRNKPDLMIRKTFKGCGFFSFSFILYNTYTVDTNFTQYFIETAPKSNIYQSYKSSKEIRHRFTQAGWHRISLKVRSIHFDSNEACTSEVWDSVFILPNVKILDITKTCLTNSLRIKVSSSFGTPFGPSYRYTFYSGKFGSNQVIRMMGPDSNFILQPIHLQSSKDFYVVVHDLNGCADSMEFEVNKENLVMPNPMKVYDFCNGSLDSISLNATDTNVYINTWTYKQQVIDSLVSKIMPKGAGYYFVKRSNAQGCSITDTIKVMHSTPFLNNIEKTIKDSCAGNITLTSKTGLGWSYQWYKDSEPISTENKAILYPKESGAYHVKVTDLGLCQRASDTLALTIYPKPQPMSIWGPKNQLDTSTIFNYITGYIPNYSYVWYLTNATGKSRLDSNAILVKFNNYGSALLVVEYRNEYNCYQQKGFEVYVDKPSVGLNQETEALEVLTYPNPTFDKLEIRIRNRNFSNEHTLMIIDDLGRLIFEQSSHKLEYAISLAGLKGEGIYMVIIKDINQKILYTGKIILENN